MVTMRSVLPLTIVAITMAIPATAGAKPAAPSPAEEAIHTGFGIVARMLTEENNPARWVGPCSYHNHVTSCPVVVRSRATRCTAIARARSRKQTWAFWLSQTQCGPSYRPRG